MGKGSGGLRGLANGGGLNNDTNSNTKPKNIAPLSSINDTQLRRSVQQGISKFESRLGIRERNINLADLGGPGGLQISDSNGSKQIYIDKGIFGKSKMVEVTNAMQKAYKKNLVASTNSPAQHIVIHELAHASWGSNYKSENSIKASTDIRKLHGEWKKDIASGKVKGYGKYATSSIDEFWAEASTKAVIGKQDKYTAAVKAIYKKHKL